MWQAAHKQRTFEWAASLPWQLTRVCKADNNELSQNRRMFSSCKNAGHCGGRLFPDLSVIEQNLRDRRMLRMSLKQIHELAVLPLDRLCDTAGV